MDIKVGDKVRYRGLSEWDLTQGGFYEVVRVGFDLIDVLDDEGDFSSFWRSDCEPVTDTPQAVPDYNNGEWHGWNGGECPVHPNSSIQWSRFCLGESGVAYQGSCNAKHAMWDTITSFRVTKPYVEPKMEVVEAYAQASLGGGFEVSSFADYWDWRITFNTIDGEPDPASIKMERMRD